jgi:hypothetical protein
VSFFLCSLYFFIQLTSIFIIYDKQGATRELTASIPQENSHGKDEGGERGGGAVNKERRGTKRKGGELEGGEEENDNRGGVEREETERWRRGVRGSTKDGGTRPHRCEPLLTGWICGCKRRLQQ